jgi:hypothetical protein
LKFLTFIFFIAGISCFAQDGKKEVFTLKPALGLNASQIHGDAYDGFDKAGLFAGIAVNAFFDEKSSLEFGFYFSQKGARHIPKPQKGDLDFYFVNLNYLDLPLLYRHNLNKSFFITLGPSFAYLINYYEEINYANFTGSYRFNQFEYTVNFGLGKKIKEKFSVEVRTTNSLFPTRDYGGIISTVFYPNPVAQFFNKGFYNNVLTLFCAYKIDLKRKTSESK